MQEYVSFNNQIVSIRNTSVSALSAAALYGIGIFTTIAIQDERPFLWEKHWLRLVGNAEKLKIDLVEFSENLTKHALAEIVQENKVTNGRARITFFDESRSSIWPFESDRKTSLLITTGDLRPVPDNFKLAVSPLPVNSRSPLAGVKSCNYLENLMTLDEAKNRGFHEAVRINERGEITSAAMANLFWLKDDVLYTPSLKTGCLAGTTREFVLENMACREALVSIDELNDAEAIFLTSAGLGVVCVSQYQSKTLSRIEHPILDLLPV